ncbi:MAG TPA: DEAD/DEAH box helicase [Thermoanaerobaculia bacterium]|nr:DEAD/DEAH box helicase [Thermoanaerobaculia bacterium]
MSGLQKLVPKLIQSRGEQYLSEGRVGEVRRESTGWIGARVRGSLPYHVEMQLDEEGTLTYLCSCPYFERDAEVCKHVWGVICRAAREGLLQGERVEFLEPFLDGDDPPEDDGDEDDDLDELPPPPSNVRPFSPRSREEWEERLARVESALPAASPLLPGDEINYVLVGMGLAGVLIDLRRRSIRRDGTPGVPRRFRMTHAQIAQLDDPDREILALLFAGAHSPHWENTKVSVRGEGGRILLSKMAATGRLYGELDQELRGPITLDDGAPWQLGLKLSRDEKRRRWRVDGELHRDGERLRIDAIDSAVAGMVLAGDRLAGIEPKDARPWIDLLRGGPLDAPDRERDEFVAAILESSPVPIDVPPELARPVERPEPKPFLRLELGSDREGEGWTGDFRVRYGEVEVVPGEGARSLVDEERILMRDLPREEELRARLEVLRVTRDYYGAWRIRTSQAASILATLAGEGWTIELHGRPLRLADDLVVEVETGIDWFDLRAEVSFGGVSVPVATLLDATPGALRKLPDGSYGIVDGTMLGDFGFLEGAEKRADGRVRFPGSQALLIDLLLRARTGVRSDPGFATLRERLATGEEVRARTEGPEFRGELRPYQRDGLGWLHHLRKLEVGGCLADDMGLGKTVQVLALLASIRSDRPSLVVAPRSLLFNWREEAARFAPGLRVVEYHGADRSPEIARDADLVLTTYGTLRTDVGRLSAMELEYVILDEAQAIKTASSQTAKSARLLRGRHRLALSGTPIENHLGELWSLFEFLNPGMLGSSKWFRRQFAGRNVSRERLGALAEAVRPLLLRRTKEQVAPELPARVEQTLWCELDPAQRKIYDDLRLLYRSRLLDKVRSEGMQKSRMHVLEALLRLRQAACDPALLDPTIRVPGAKLETLLEELSEVIDSGHRALVFSQFTSFLRLAARRLEKQKVDYAWLDGSTTDRQSVVRAFQAADGPPVFLISLRAGGTGLNLTNADYVFLLDPWWNPAVEAQAIDRTHRIGQDKPVFAYRLIARDTVEEKILELQSSKRELAESILTEDNSVIRNLDVETLERLLS